MNDFLPNQTIHVELDLSDLATLSTALAGTATQSRLKAATERDNGSLDSAAKLEELAAKCEKLLKQLGTAPRRDTLRPPVGASTRP